MKPNHFIYADLSTYKPDTTMAFYSKVFGWVFHKQAGTTDETHGAYLGQQAQEVASIYQMPEKFQAMGMPHFWMSYIQVNSVAQTVEKAKALGGIIEMTQNLAGYGDIALIRDPQGAGFTVYAGDALTPTRTRDQANTLIWNELHISNAQNIIPFYEGIFDWRFEQDAKEQYHYRIISGGEHIGDALEIPNELKGQYEYWVCTFGVEDVQKTQKIILDNGGTLIIDEGERVLLTDNSGEAFFYIKKSFSKELAPTPTAKPNIKWKAMLGLGLIIGSMLLEQYWIMGVFFLIWLVMDIRSGVTHLFEPVTKQKNPILFWAIMLTWLALSGFSFMV